MTLSHRAETAKPEDARGPTDYDTLKQAGHSPAKAAEIVLDAKRGDLFAVEWIAIARSQGQ